MGCFGKLTACIPLLPSICLSPKSSPTTASGPRSDLGSTCRQLQGSCSTYTHAVTHHTTDQKNSTGGSEDGQIEREGRGGRGRELRLKGGCETGARDDNRCCGDDNRCCGGDNCTGDCHIPGSCSSTGVRIDGAGHGRCGPHGLDGMRPSKHEACSSSGLPSCSSPPCAASTLNALSSPAATNACLQLQALCSAAMLKSGASLSGEPAPRGRASGPRVSTPAPPHPQLCMDALTIVIHVTGRDSWPLPSCCRLLHHALPPLTRAHCSHLRAPAAQAHLARLTQLHTLILEQKTHAFGSFCVVNTAGLITVLQSLTQLRHLSLRNDTITAQLLSEALPRLTSLTHLRLGAVNISRPPNDVLKSRKKWKQLLSWSDRLSWEHEGGQSSAGCNTALQQALLRLHNLQHLDLAACRSMRYSCSDGAWEAVLTGLTKLTHLTLPQLPCGYESWVLALPNLREVSFTLDPFRWNTAESWVEAAHLSALTNLSSLNLTTIGDHMTNSSEVWLPHLVNLRRLECWPAFRSVRMLSALTKLTHLHGVQWAGNRDLCTSQLASLSALRHLSVRFSEQCDGVAQVLTQLSLLTHLTLQHCSRFSALAQGESGQSDAAQAGSTLSDNLADSADIAAADSAGSAAADSAGSAAADSAGIVAADSAGIAAADSAGIAAADSAGTSADSAGAAADSAGTLSMYAPADGLAESDSGEWFPRLHTLHLEHCNLADCIALFSPRLRCLAISFPYHWSETCSQALQHLQALQELDLFDCPFLNETLQHLTSLSQLRKLAYKHYDPSVGDFNLAPLGQISSLTCLDFAIFPTLSHAASLSLICLSQLTRLQHLSLLVHIKVGAASHADWLMPKLLPTLVQLQTLELGEQMLTPACEKALAKLTNLELCKVWTERRSHLRAQAVASLLALPSAPGVVAGRLGSEDFYFLK